MAEISNHADEQTRKSCETVLVTPCSKDRRLGTIRIGTKKQI